MEVNKDKKGVVVFLLGVFCVIIFLIFVIFFFINVKKYNDIYDNPKLLNKQIIEEGNNYIRFSNMLFRVVKFNSDGSIDIILDEPFNMMMWNDKFSNYVDSDINKFLNTEFIKYLDLDFLDKTMICTDNLLDIDNITCNNKNFDYYVKVLSVSDYLSSLSFDNNMWLSSTFENGDIAISNGNGISLVTNNTFNYVYPVVTLKNSVILLSGSGKKDDPYLIDNSININVGSYVKLDDDIYRVVDVSDDRLYLESEYLDSGNLLHRYGDINYDVSNSDSLAYYLNNDFYDSLSYKNVLLDFYLYTGSYSGKYEDIYSSKRLVKVGVPTIIDIIDKDSSYFFANSLENEIYYYNVSGVLMSQLNYFRNVKVKICINNSVFVDGDGSINAPFVMR